VDRVAFLYPMKKLLIIVTGIVLAPFLHADLFNQSVTAIYGSGNPDAGWAADSSNGIQLDLRAKNRTTGTTTNVGGVYSFATGYDSTNTRALWNYEFSINSGTANLSSYDYFLGVDLDPSQAINYLVFDPLAAFNDNSYGNNSTLNGQGLEGAAATYASSNGIAQNSENIVFLGLNPNLDATYNFDLFAVAKGAGSNGKRLVDVDITVIVGKGGASVPDSGSTSLLLLLGLCAIGGFKFQRKNLRA
jgi:hypothetical protein